MEISDKEILPLIEKTLDQKNPRNWYYALMDYGVILKKSGVKTFAQQKGFTKQSKFKGSRRYVRGYILKQLTDKAKLAVKDIVLPGYESEIIASIIKDLIEEKLVQSKNKSLMLPS